MTETEIKNKIAEYLDLFEPDDRDTAAELAKLLGITGEFGTGLLELSFGFAIAPIVNAVRETTISAFTNGGKINELNKIIHGSLVNLALGGGAVDAGWSENFTGYFQQIQNYIDDTYESEGTSLLEFLREITPVESDRTTYSLEKLITEENLNKSTFAVEYYIESFRAKNDFFANPQNKIFRTFLEEVITNRNSDKLGVKWGLPIATVLQNQYSPDRVGELIAELVSYKINNMDPILIDINKAGSNLFTFKQDNSTGSIIWKIVQDALYPEQKGVTFRVGGNAVVASTPLGKLQKDTTNWPVDATGGDSENEALLIRENNLADINIETYEFNYWTEFDVSWVESWRVWWVDDPKTPQESLKAVIGNKYVEFILEILRDYEVDGDLDTSIGGKFKKIYDDDFILQVYNLVAIDKEIARRLESFKALEQIRDDEIVGDSGDLTNEQLKKIQAAGLKAFALSEGEPGKKPLTEEQIEDRQRFYKQCALMLNIKRLDEKFEDVIIDRQTVYKKFDGPIKKKPFGGRFWRAESKNTEQLITNLVSSKDAGYMFEIPTHIMTQLTPKFRLYKVFNDQNGKLKDTEFIFPTYTDIDRKKNFTPTQNTKQEPTIPTFLSSQFDKGDGVGLKSFSIDFNGTNPAEARNDVKGQMSLFFQSFADFTRKRVDPNDNEYRFVDLIIQPKADPSNRTQGVKITSLRQYEPSFYRIRVDMGYNIPKEGDIQGISEDKNKKGESDLTRLQNALRAMNKSFYLCMIDHDFNINNDGTVQMNFTYRAYLETALKSLRFDALTTPELARRRIENETKLHDAATSKKCTKNELIELQLALAGVEEEMVLNSLNSIMNRMYSRDKVFTVEVDNEDRKFFLKNGFYRSCDLIGSVALNNTPAASSDGDLGIVLNSTFLSAEPSVNFERDINDTNIQFFFFGDLLHTILDALYDPDDETRKRVAVGLENTKIILGHFEFDPYQANASSGKYNISNIPISVDFFGEWFKQNILNQKSTRRTFPILNFIRNLSNHLVNNALLESCVNRDIDKSIRFQTGQISAISSDGKDPIGKLINRNKTYGVLNTDTMRRYNKLPLNGDVEGNPNVDNFYHYIVLSCNGSALTYAGTGKYKEDIEAGRFHVEIGSNRGLVKNVKFAKTDMQYLREARFFRNGTDGLLQLSSVYTATVEMFGNTLFYPGMDLWINPYGFGGTALGSPHQGDRGTKKISNRSLSNILGLGGYHTITGVSINLTPQAFTTSIKSQHYYSGDGDVPDAKGLKANTDKKENELIEQGVAEDAKTRDAAFCESEILEVINFNARDDNSGNTTPSISAPTSGPAGTSGLAPFVDIPNISSTSDENGETQEGPGTYTVGGEEFTGEFIRGKDGYMYFHYVETSVVEGYLWNSTNEEKQIMRVWR